MYDDRPVFREELLERLSQPERISKSALLEAAADFDHPAVDRLGLNQAVEGEAAVLFLDIRGYTRLSMALARPEAARILDAVISASIKVLRDRYGAHIQDFTGDGIMAVFGGPAQSLDAAHEPAIQGACGLMADMEATLREDLLKSGIRDPVQVAMGMVSGEVLWTRIGTEQVNRVMIVGEVAPLASKYVSGGETSAWEILVGGAIGDAVPDAYKIRRPDFEVQHDYEKLKRKRWLLDWKKAGSLASPADAKALLGVTSLPSFQSIVGKVTEAPQRHGAGTRREYPTG